MKTLAAVYFCLVVLLTAGCCTIGSSGSSSWFPYVGCSEEELFEHWGGCCGDSYHSSYGNSDVCWYHKQGIMLVGEVIGPCYRDRTGSICNYAVTITDGKVESVSTHYCY